jgi:hypothetical protein
MIATGDWTAEMRRRAEQALDNALVRAGDPKRERLFRMNITLCLHRALSAEEKLLLPDGFDEQPGGLAGGPIELLRVTGLPPRPAGLPCEKPTHEILDPDRPDLWLPIDCGECEPCRARRAIRKPHLSREARDVVTRVLG